MKYSDFLQETKYILLKIFKGKSINWINKRILYDLIKKNNLKNIFHYFNKSSDTILSSIIYFISYSYIPSQILIKYYPNFIYPSKKYECNNLFKYLIFYNENNIIISFRGTKTWMEILNNFKFYRTKYNIFNDKQLKDFFKWRNNLNKLDHLDSFRVPLKKDKDIEIHKGFMNEVNSIYYDFINKISDKINANTNIILCGHSLGGVLATLVGIQLAKDFSNRNISIITFNMPPIGNKNFNLIIPYLKIKNFVRLYNYQDFIPFYGYFGSWIDSKRFRHFDYMLKGGIIGEENKDGRFIQTKIDSTSIFVKDYGIYLNEIIDDKYNMKLVYHNCLKLSSNKKIIYV